MAITKISSALIGANTIATANIADNAVDGTKIAQNSILTKHIDDDQIVTSHIADDAVTLAKMDGLARGKIIVGDASGNPVALALGSSGQVLKSDGTDLAFAADSGLSSEEVQDIAGAMFSSNTETGITATYQDADGTIDLVVGTLNQNTTGSAATLTTPRAIAVAGAVTGTVNFDGSAGVSITSTLANNAVLTQHIDDNQVTADQIAAATITTTQIAANTIATGNVADNAIDGTKIASNSILTRHIDDDQVTGDQLADALTVVTSVTTPLVDAAIIDGENFKVNGGQGSDGQVLTSTGSGAAWEDAGGGSVSAVANGANNRITTFSSSDALNGEANLTFDGNTLQTVGSANVTRVGPIGQGSGAVQTWNVSSAANTYFVPSDNNTVMNPGGTAVAGAIIQVEIAMGSTVYAIAWQNKFKFSGDGSTPTVTATANKTDIFTFRYNGTVWQEIGRVQNLAQTV